MIDKDTVVLLGSQLPNIRKAFDSFAEQHPNEPWLENCAQRFEDPRVTCTDFIVLDRVQGKLMDPTAHLTRSDYFDSDIKPFKILKWVYKHPKEVSVAFSPHTFRGVTTRAALLEFGDTILNAQAKQFKGETINVFVSAVHYGAIAIAGIALIFIIGMGSFILSRLVRRISESVGVPFGRELAADAILFGNAHKPKRRISHTRRSLGH